MASDIAEHVVVDSAAFIKNAQLQDIAKHVYTIQDVVREIRDYETKKRLSIAPYEIIFREPPPDCVRFVTQFAKKTGDYPSLSAVDIRIMALTYQLTKEHVGLDHIKQEPVMQTTWSSSTKPLDKPTDMVGWYLPPKSFSDSKSEHESVVTEKIGQADDQEDIILERIQQDELDEADSLKNEHCDDIAIDEVDSEITNHSTLPEDLPLKSDEEQNMEEECADDAENSDEDSGHSDDGDNDDDNDNDDDDDDDDDEGWITPRNIKRITKHFSGNNESSQGAKVGCMTTDFAMQNVLIQMGIPVLSLNGMFIKRTKTYVLKCSGCFKVTAIMTKQFCPHCGNKTLMKVTVTLDDNGKQHFHMSRRKIENKRGLKYSLPMPQGGKHATNPHLVEDQPFPKNRPSRKALKKTNAFDPNYAASVSPFATHDVTSRAAQLGVNRFGSHSGKKRNPNENRSRRK